MEDNVSNSERCIAEITKAAEMICEETKKLRDVAVGKVRLLEAKGTENSEPNENMQFLQKPFDLEKLKSLFGELMIGGVDAFSKALALGKFSLFCHNKGITVDILVSNSKGHVWTCDPNKTLRLSDDTGTSVYTKKLDFMPDSVAVTDSRDIYLAAYKDKKVKRLQPDGKLKNVLDTSPLHPVGVGVTQNGDLLLCLIDSFDFQSQTSSCDVVKVSMEDNMATVDSMKYVDKAYTWKLPYRIIENVNNDVIVIDGKSERSGNVVIFTKDGRFLSAYNGESSGSFCPVDICTDCNGNILVIDAMSDSIHVLDKTGDLKMKISSTETGSTMMSALSIGDDGFLWVGHKSGEVTRFNWTALE